MMKHVDHILFRPYGAVSCVLIEEPVVSVLALFDIPFIEVLDHHHESHLITKLDKFFCRHVV